MRRDTMMALCATFFILGAFILVLPVAAYAAEVTFNGSGTEVFLGDCDDSNYFYIRNDGALFGTRAEFNFNLNSPGDEAYLYINASIVKTEYTPTTDVVGFETDYYLIDSAMLSITVSSSDAHSDTVEVWSGLDDGSLHLGSEEFSLGSFIGTDLWYLWSNSGREYGTLTIDLMNILTASDFISDGRFQTLIMALDTGTCDFNDFRLDTVSL